MAREHLSEEAQPDADGIAAGHLALIASSTSLTLPGSAQVEVRPNAVRLMPVPFTSGLVTNDHQVAATLATEAGDLLLAIRSHGGAEGDRRSNDLLLRHLADLRPDDAVLSEESLDDPVRLGRHRVWIIDPLDGTREYGEPPREDWAVHVALAVDGRPVVGAVALPATGRLLSTLDPPIVAPPARGPIRIAVSRTRPPACVDQLLARLDAVVVPMGSAGAKAMAVVLGDVDVYAHSGGQYEWDSCAPVAVATAAGLHVSRLDGSPLVYNQPDPYLPDLLVSRPEIAGRVLAALRGP